MSLSKRVLEVSDDLRRRVNGLSFSHPTHTIYNPLDYAWECHKTYVERFADKAKKVVFLGMNPGPWGMAQVGIPFGEIAAVRDWIGICEPVGKPFNEHPKRPIEGFDCSRSEVSGRRLWGLFKERFGTPDGFFLEHYVLNYCPLVFMESGGRNRTPDKLPSAERERLYAICDEHLRGIVKILSPEWLIGIGKFAVDRAENALSSTSIKTGWILHPSPASPAANRDWKGLAERKMLEMGVWNRLPEKLTNF
jgi:single-strand selective monofunctional uracil DNA glycosylase